MGARRQVLVDLERGIADLRPEPQGRDPAAPRPPRKVARAAEEFREDLKTGQFAYSLDSYLYGLSDDRADWFAIFFLGPLWAYLLQHAEDRQRQRAELDRLFSEMANYIVVLLQ
jgi:hypothetical protein